VKVKLANSVGSHNVSHYHGTVSGITTADGHTSAANSRRNPRRFKWTRPFRRKTKLVSVRVPPHFKRSLKMFKAQCYEMRFVVPCKQYHKPLSHKKSALQQIFNVQYGQKISSIK